jgi:hypothetical protein
MVGTALAGGRADPAEWDCGLGSYRFMDGVGARDLLFAAQ